MSNTQAQDMRSHARAAIADALRSIQQTDLALAQIREALDDVPTYPAALDDARDMLPVADQEAANAKHSAAAALARMDSADDLDGRALFSPRAVYGRTLYDPRNAAAQGLTNLAGARTLTAQQLDGLSLAGVLVAIYGQHATAPADLPRHVPTVPTPPAPR